MKRIPCISGLGVPQNFEVVKCAVSEKRLRSTAQHNRGRNYCSE